MTPPTPQTLRAIANWLESHPEAHVDVVSFCNATPEVQCLLVEDPGAFADRRNAIGGKWTQVPGPGNGLTTYAQWIGEGITYSMLALSGYSASLLAEAV